MRVRIARRSASLARSPDQGNNRCDKGLTRLAWATTIPNYANWIITAFKAFLKVAGVDATGDGKNDLVFGLLTAFVVLPSFAAVGAWVYGFFGPKKA